MEKRSDVDYIPKNMFVLHIHIVSAKLIKSKMIRNKCKPFVEVIVKNKNQTYIQKTNHDGGKHNPKWYKQFMFYISGRPSCIIFKVLNFINDTKLPELIGKYHYDITTHQGPFFLIKDDWDLIFEKGCLNVSIHSEELFPLKQPVDFELTQRVLVVKGPYKGFSGNIEGKKKSYCRQLDQYKIHLEMKKNQHNQAMKFRERKFEEEEKKKKGR